MAQQNTHASTSVRRRIILLVGDILVILSFVVIGRQSHSLSLTDITSSLFTALPFLIGWFAVMPWFGIYRTPDNRTPQKFASRFLAGWLCAGLLALVLRALFLGRAIPEGIMPIFALVSLGYIGLVGLGWRWAYMWWSNRRSDRAPNRPTEAKL